MAKKAGKRAGKKAGGKKKAGTRNLSAKAASSVKGGLRRLKVY